jgi:hypothetical protein
MNIKIFTFSKKYLDLKENKIKNMFLKLDDDRTKYK